MLTVPHSSIAMPTLRAVSHYRAALALCVGAVSADILVDALNNLVQSMLAALPGAMPDTDPPPNHQSCLDDVQNALNEMVTSRDLTTAVSSATCCERK